ncbi:MAG: GNAT family N-acetyltransferase [Chloroflexota bacterium]
MTEVQISEFSRDQVAEAVPLLQEIDKERVPEDPVLPTAAYVRRLTALPPDVRQFFWGARDAQGTLVGVAFAQLPDRENVQMAFGVVMVAPKARRHGIGRSLVRKLTERVKAEGRVLVATETSDRVPSGVAFATALGAAPGLEAHTNQLDIAALDAAMIRQAIEASRQKAAGYRLDRIDWSIADDMTLARVATAYEAINDMPKGDIPLEMEHWDAERVRKRHEFHAKLGTEVWTVIAIHEASGEAVGFTELNFNPDKPEIAQQQGTAVTPAHRGHALGMWLKADVLERLLREKPKTKFIRTGNAKVNEAMLRINTELGFRPAWSETIWQAPVATLEQHLG